MAALGRALLAVAVAGNDGAWAWAGALSLSTGRFSGETARDWWHPCVHEIHGTRTHTHKRVGSKWSTVLQAAGGRPRQKKRTIWR